MIILVDVDGVVAQFYQSMLKHVSRIAAVRFYGNEKLANSLRYSDVTTYWCYDQMPEEHVRIAKEVTSQDGFWQNLPEVPLAVEAINKLHKQHTVIFVTHPTTTCPTWAAARLQWLQRRFPWVTPDSLIVTAAKQYVDGDVLIEDAAHNLESWLNERYLRNPNRDYKGFLFYAPYNRHKKVQYGWQGILKALRIRNDS